MNDNVASLLKDVRDLLTLARNSSSDNESNSLFPPTVALTVEDLQLLHDTIDEDELEIEYLNQRVVILKNHVDAITIHTPGDCYVCDHLNWSYLRQAVDIANEERATLAATLARIWDLNIPQVNEMIGEHPWLPQN